MTYTPMIYTARLVKHTHPGSKVVFIGPCAAKKLEAMQQELRSDVDFVLTYEELMGIFEAKDIDFSKLPTRRSCMTPPDSDAVLRRQAASQQQWKKFCAAHSRTWK